MLLSVVQAALVCSIAWFLWKSFRYLFVKSDLDNLPGPTSPSFWVGHFKKLRAKNGWGFHREIVDNYGRVARLKGAFGRNMLWVFDPKAVHQIAVKDLDIFEEAESFSLLTGNVFGPGLFATHGEYHRKQRKMLNPVFSINHMRHMMPIFNNVVHKLKEALMARVCQEATEIDMLVWMGRTALELMGQAGLGHSFDPLVQDVNDGFALALKEFMPAIAALGPFLQLYPLALRITPRILQRPLGRLVPLEGLRKLMDISDTIRATSLEIYNEKKRALFQGDEALKQQVGEGKDVMSVLLKANMMSSEEDRLSEEELIGQVGTLTFAAVDTTSNALSLTLWRLAQHPDVQEKLRQEVLQAQDAQGGGDIGYDELVSLPYLDAVCRETLRIDIPAPLRFREARQDTMLSLSEPVRGLDGRMMSEILVPKDTPVFISIMGSNTDPDLWGPDALEWKPERWLAPSPQKLQDAKIPGVYSNLMTFWAGGRACIGFKFSQLEMKVVLAMLVANFKFELTEKTINWNISGVVYPSVDKEGNKASLPMKVSLLKN